MILKPSAVLRTQTWRLFGRSSRRNCWKTASEQLQGRPGKLWLGTGTIELVSKRGPGGIVWHAPCSFDLPWLSSWSRNFWSIHTMLYSIHLFSRIPLLSSILSQTCFITIFPERSTSMWVPCYVEGKAHVFKSLTYICTTLLSSSPVEHHFPCCASEGLFAASMWFVWQPHGKQMCTLSQRKPFSLIGYTIA